MNKRNLKNRTNINVNNFINWLITQPNANGSLYLERVARRYAWYMKSTPLRLEISLPLESRDVFSCQTLEDFEQLQKILISAPNYKIINSIGHYTFSSGMKCYARYLSHFTLNYKNSADNQKQLEEQGLNKLKNFPTSLIKVLAESYQNGFRFDSTIIRLLTDKAGVEIDAETQSSLKKHMFCRNDDLYFLLDVVADEKTRINILESADNLLDQFKCFEISELYNVFIEKLNSKCIINLDDFEAFYKFINNRDICCTSKYGMKIARLQGQSLNDILLRVSKKITMAVYDCFNGVVSEEDLQNHFCAFSPTLISNIIKEYIVILIKTKINGIVCYQTIESLGLPECFSNTISEMLVRFDELGLVPTEDALHTAISVQLGVNFRSEYNIIDGKTYRYLISTYYKDTPKREWKHGKFVEVPE